MPQGPSGAGRIGAGLPRHPQITRKRPAPFTRPQVALGGTEHRSWQTVHARRLVVGDTVPDVGLLVMTTHTDDGNVLIQGQDGTTEIMAASMEVFAFTLVADTELGAA